MKQKICDLGKIKEGLSTYFNAEINRISHEVHDPEIVVLASQKSTVPDDIAIICRLFDEDNRSKIMAYYPLRNAKCWFENGILPERIVQAKQMKQKVFENKYLKVDLRFDDTGEAFIIFMMKEDELVPRNQSEAKLKLAAFCLTSRNEACDALLWKQKLDFEPCVLYGVPGFVHIVKEYKSSADMMLVGEECVYLEDLLYSFRKVQKKSKKIFYFCGKSRKDVHYYYFKEGCFYRRREKYVTESEARSEVGEFVKKNAKSPIMNGLEIKKHFIPMYKGGIYSWLAADNDKYAMLVDTDSGGVKICAKSEIETYIRVRIDNKRFFR